MNTKTEWMDCGVGVLGNPVTGKAVITRVVELKGQGRIGEWHDYSNEPEQNFRAIVNAPAMYRALKMVQEDVNQMGCECDGDHTALSQDCMVCAVNKVISDVEGRTNES